MPGRATADHEPAPPVKLTRAEKAERTRARLFHAATETVGERGYADTSIAKITEQYLAFLEQVRENACFW